MHEIITALFWLQVRQEFNLKLRWVSSEDNAEADDLSRPDADQYVRLQEETFAEICTWVGRDFVRYGPDGDPRVRAEAPRKRAGVAVLLAIPDRGMRRS